MNSYQTGYRHIYCVVSSESALNSLARVGPDVFTHSITIAQRVTSEHVLCVGHDGVLMVFNVHIYRAAKQVAKYLHVDIVESANPYDLVTKYYALLVRTPMQTTCELGLLPECIFSCTNPLVFGAQITSGILQLGSQLTVPSKESLHIGAVSSIEYNGDQVDEAHPTAKVVLRIDGPTNVRYGKHFDARDPIESH